jgi:hypothetical protein
LRRDPKSLLWDAREAANAIAAMTAGKSFGDFDGDIVLRSAVERSLVSAPSQPRVASVRNGIGAAYAA